MCPLLFLLWIPPCPPSSPMWRCPSCLSMQWTSLTRCQDTCWTWMTRQAPWLPWQRLSWLAVSLRLVFCWQVLRSSKRDDGSAYYLQADLLPTHSNHWHSPTSPSAPKYLHSASLSVPHFIPEHAALPWESFLWYFNQGRPVDGFLWQWWGCSSCPFETVCSFCIMKARLLVNIFKELWYILFWFSCPWKCGVVTCRLNMIYFFKEPTACTFI